MRGTQKRALALEAPSRNVGEARRVDQAQPELTPTSCSPLPKLEPPQGLEKH